MQILNIKLTLTQIILYLKKKKKALGPPDIEPDPVVPRLVEVAGPGLALAHHGHPFGPGQGLQPQPAGRGVDRGRQGEEEPAEVGPGGEVGEGGLVDGDGVVAEAEEPAGLGHGHQVLGVPAGGEGGGAEGRGALKGGRGPGCWGAGGWS